MFAAGLWFRGFHHLLFLFVVGAAKKSKLPGTSDSDSSRMRLAAAGALKKENHPAPLHQPQTDPTLKENEKAAHVVS